MRQCAKCHQELPFDAFALRNKSRGTRQSYCRVCTALVGRAHYAAHASAYQARALVSSKRGRARNRLRLELLLRDQFCTDCGAHDLAVLEFDHRGAKRGNVSDLVRSAVAWETVLQEIAKCDVVCANCHRRRTARQFDWYKLAPEPLELPALPQRGTPGYEAIKSRRSLLQRRHRNRELLSQFLRQHPCSACGEADPTVLDFDHLADKRFDIAHLLVHGGTQRLLAEMAKCRVVCANCHRRATAQRAGRDR
jgi:uncharacterized CHY-type Zn-finger protein